MKKRTAKQIAALVAVILLAALYIVTLVVAIVDPTASGKWFVGCLVCTMAVPLLAWIFIWIYGETTGKKTIADLHLMQDADADGVDGADAQETVDAEIADTETK